MLQPAPHLLLQVHHELPHVPSSCPHVVAAVAQPPPLPLLTQFAQGPAHEQQGQQVTWQEAQPVTPTVLQACGRADAIRAQASHINAEEERATLWHPILKRKLSGTAAPKKKNLHAYFQRNPAWELYNHQDLYVTQEEKRKIIDAEKRITIWNRVTKRRTSGLVPIGAGSVLGRLLTDTLAAGNAAPREAKLESYLKSHPDCEVYNCQDRDWDRMAIQRFRQQQAEGKMTGAALSTGRPRQLPSSTSDASSMAYLQLADGWQKTVIASYGTAPLGPYPHGQQDQSGSSAKSNAQPPPAPPAVPSVSLPPAVPWVSLPPVAPAPAGLKRPKPVRVMPPAWEGPQVKVAPQVEAPPKSLHSTPCTQPLSSMLQHTQSAQSAQSMPCPTHPSTQQPLNFNL